jgi:ribosomal 50S subunit-associated protein YjgA (DUF615 family)
MGRIRKEEQHKDEGRGRTQVRNEARVIDGLAEKLFELPEALRRAFPGSESLSRALLINRTNLVKNGRKRHLRYIAGLLRDEGFTAEQLESYLEGGSIELEGDSGPDLVTLRDRLCDPDSFEDALASAIALLPVLDSDAIRRHAQAVHQSDDRRAFSALYKTLRQAADALADED